MTKMYTVTTGRHRALSATLISAVLFASSSALWAGPREQAKRIHDRIAGVPPSEAVLDQMQTLIEGGDPVAAAELAMTNDGFYDVTLKNMVAPWTNEAQSVFVPLNDYTATVIGAVRDDLDFRRILYDNIVYTGRSSLGLPAYSLANNDHFEQVEASGEPLQTALVSAPQPQLLPAEAAAGILTTRAAGAAFFSAGTNRAMLRFTLMNHLCNDLEQLNDTSRAPDRVRQDVSRSPGGDSRNFLNSCVGCHSGMDPLAQAFAYYDYEYDQTTDPEALNGTLVYNTAGMLDPNGTRVQDKYLINATNFEYGFVTPDDRWDNYWRAGPNTFLGWDGGLSGHGNGASSMGQELAHSAAFAQCHVTNVFKAVCLRAPSDSADETQIGSMISSFSGDNFRLKTVFAESAAYCMGD